MSWCERMQRARAHLRYRLPHVEGLDWGEGRRAGAALRADNGAGIGGRLGGHIGGRRRLQALAG